LINEIMAKRYWPQDDPIGQRIIIGGNLGPDSPIRRVRSSELSETYENSA